jgi:hypothetical protein
MRDRAAALIGTGGAGAKLTAGVVTAAVVAGGTIGATQALDQRTTRAHRDRTARPPATWTEALVTRPVARPRDRSVSSTSLRRTRRRPPSSYYLAASPDQTAGRYAPARQGAAEREFGLESATGAQASTDRPVSHAGEGGGEAPVEREFGG